MVIDYAKAYQDFIDEELGATSVTHWMTPTGGVIKYEGGKDIQIATLTTTGLGSYDPTKTDGSAYPQGAVTSKWENHVLTMDRGVKFALDRTDPSDSGFIATAENVMREFARTQLTKEQDTYRINKLFKLASAGGYSATNVMSGAVTKDNAVSELFKALEAVQKSSEQLSGFVAIINQDLKGAFLESSNANYNSITFSNAVEINGVRYESVMMVNDLPCLFAPSSRMQTEIKVNTGRSGDMGGVAVASGSKTMNFVICGADGPIAVSKIDSLKQFAPCDNQLFDGTAIQARYLYDLFLPKNKVCSVAVHTKA